MTECVLGFTSPEAPPTGDVRIARIDPDIALACANRDALDSPIRRLEACVRLHEAFPAIVPFASRSVVPRASALAYLRENRPMVVRHLERAHGSVTLHATMDLSPCAHLAARDAASGRAWLADRRKRQQEQRKTQTEVLQWFRSLLSGVPIEGHMAHGGKDRITVDLVVPSASVDAVKQGCVTGMLATRPPPSIRLPVLVSGPWPLFLKDRQDADHVA